MCLGLQTSHGCEHDLSQVIIDRQLRTKELSTAVEKKRRSMGNAGCDLVLFGADLAQGVVKQDSLPVDASTSRPIAGGSRCICGTVIHCLTGPTGCCNRLLQVDLLSNGRM